MHRVLVEKHQEKLPLSGPKHRWKDKIEIGIDGGDLINLAQDTGQWRAFVDNVMNLRFHKGRRFLDHVNKNRFFT
jgi:hypothetical protein